MGATGLDIGVESSKYKFNKIRLVIANDIRSKTARSSIYECIP